MYKIESILIIIFQPCSPCVLRGIADECYAGQVPPQRNDSHQHASRSISHNDRVSSLRSTTSHSTGKKRLRILSSQSDEEELMENRSNADPSKTYKDKSSLAPGTLQAALSESVEKLHETEALLLRAQLAFQEQRQSKQSGQLRQDHVSWTDLQDVIPNEMNCSHLIDVFFSSVS